MGVPRPLSLLITSLRGGGHYTRLVAGSDKKVSPRPRNDNDQVDESHETQTNVSPTVLGPTPPKA